MSSLLEIRNLKVAVGKKVILKGISLSLNKGEIHVVMGPNGSGKSTLANVISGNPKFSIVEGDILFKGESIMGYTPEERAMQGIFMAFQYPKEISGLALDRFLFTAYSNLQKARNPKAQPLSVFEFNEKVSKELQKLKMKVDISSRGLNEGFSGGEKKKSEMLQLAVLEPTLAILDETDSGLDIDALKVVGASVNRFINKNRSVLLVTHYQRILQYLRPDFVHVMIQGRIVESGGIEVAEKLEREGYEKYQN